MSIERRDNPRFTVDQIVELSFGREAFVHGTGLNISNSGILCSTDSYLEPYSQVSLLVSITVGKESYRFGCEGIVVRAEPYEGRFLSGISFTSLDDADERKLNTFLAQQKPTR